MKTLFSIILGVCLFSGIYAQSYKVEGTITDATSNDPLPGVNVVIKGTTQGTVSDANGKYVIKYAYPEAILVFSFIGYITEEISVNEQTIVNVKLVADIKQLDEVVVVGYGTQKRVAITSASTSVGNSKRSKSLHSTGKRQGRLAGISCNTPVQTNDESYAGISENGFKNTGNNPLSTFSIDVDKASYSNVRRFINNGQRPPADAVRVEEMINYFEYNYPQPTDEHPFAIYTEVATCPWQEDHKLLHIGVQGKKIDTRELPPSNLVFLIDVSGSMGDPNKLPLLKTAFNLLVDNLRENDRVAIVVYAGAAGCVLPSTSGCRKQEIHEAINQLGAGGSTAGGAGIKLAYKIARENYIDGGNNRVILATDGDFNVGASSDGEMEDLITKERGSGVFLTCLGFGMGNYKDSKLETLADKGNGNYAYIDNLQEANKTLVSEFGGTLFTIAKDVKIQVEFNPAYVQAYRLVGYENRLLNDEDFKDDTKDAGELGAGHTVTALYEIIPVGVKSKFQKDIDPLKYQKKVVTEDSDETREIATVKMRYKKPDGLKSIQLDKPIAWSTQKIEDASENIRFASAVAMFGMLLRDSEFKGKSSIETVVSLAQDAKSNDSEGYKAEFVRLAKSSANIINLALNE